MCAARHKCVRMSVCVCLTVSVHCVCTQAEFVYVCECEGVGGGGSHPCRTAVPVTIWGWETEEGPGLTLLGTPKQTHPPARSICSLDTQRPSRTLAGCKQTGKFKAKPGHHVLWGIFWPSCAHTSTYSCPSPGTRVTFQNASVPTKGTPSQPGVPSAPESSSQGSRKTKEGVAFRPRESPHVFFSLEQTRVQEFKEVRLCSCTRTSRP